MDRLSKLKIIPLEDIQRALKIALPAISNTPLVKLNVDIPGKEVYLKLENMQPVNSFKVRSAFNAMAHMDENKLKDGVYTASAGNFAQGLAWSAKRLGVSCNIICPLETPQIKIDKIKQLGGNIMQVPYERFWQVMMDGKCETVSGTFVHPCWDFDVMAGNGVIGLEIQKQLPDVDTIVCSYGGGGHCIGIASAMKQTDPRVKVYACEVETSAPLHESLQANEPVYVKNYQKSFVDGMNGKAMHSCVWNLATSLIEGSVVLSLREICDALKLVAVNNKLITEGAAAATVAAALKDEIPDGKIVCVISGGNIDIDKLITVLSGEIPSV